MKEFVTELRKLIHQVGKLFSDMLLQIRTEPEKVQSTVEQISHIFSNMAHLLNLLRAHQSRQSLICALHHQIESRNEKAKELEDLVERCQNILSKHKIV